MFGRGRVRSHPVTSHTRGPRLLRPPGPVQFHQALGLVVAEVVRRPRQQDVVRPGDHRGQRPGPGIVLFLGIDLAVAARNYQTITF